MSPDGMRVRRAGAVRSGRCRWKGRKAGGAGQVTADAAGGPRGKATLIGATGNGVLHHFEFHDAGNAANPEVFLMRAHRKLGKLLACTGNSPYHGRKVFQKPYRRTGGGIAVGLLPGYTRELAPIEPRRRGIKRYTANLLFGDRAGEGRRDGRPGARPHQDRKGARLSRGLTPVLKTPDINRR